MVQITIFSGRTGRIHYDNALYLTVFGGFDLIHPTVAQLLLSQRGGRSAGQRAVRRPFFLTIFGGGCIRVPTLAAEFIDLRDSLHGGLITMDDWDRGMSEVAQQGRSMASLTLFGGVDECKLPSENEEIDSLAVQRHLGNISESVSSILQYGVGQHDVERRSTVRRAIVSAA